MTTTLVPRDYQQVGIDWLRSRRRAALWDDPGLGKTLQASLAAITPVLVVCPSYLCSQWEEFIDRQFTSTWEECLEMIRQIGDAPSMAAYQHLTRAGLVVNAAAESLGEERVRAMPRSRRTEALDQRAQWTIVNHEMFSVVKKQVGTHTTHHAFSFDPTPMYTQEGEGEDVPDIEYDTTNPTYDTLAYKFPLSHYQTLIIDEAHQMAGHSSSRAQRLVAAAKQIPHVIELTGTPIYKAPDDLYMQLRYLDPPSFTSYWQFVDQYCATTEDGYTSKVVGARADALPALHELLAKYGMGRTYAEVGMALPQLIERKVTLSWSHPAFEEYTHARRSLTSSSPTYRTLDNAGTLLDTLRNLTKTPTKAEAITRIIDDHNLNFYQQSSGAPGAVVFCWYKDTARTLATALDCPLITGSIPAGQRFRIANRANGTIVATIASLSEGLDLSRYRCIIFAEEDWVPGRMAQAIARVRRYRHSTTTDTSTATEKADPVYCYYIHMDKSVDQVIHYIWHQQRATTINEVLRRALLEV